MPLRKRAVPRPHAGNDCCGIRVGFLEPDKIKREKPFAVEWVQSIERLQPSLWEAFDMKNSALALVILVPAAATAAPVFAGGRGHGGPQGASRGSNTARPAAASFLPRLKLRYARPPNFGTSRPF